MEDENHVHQRNQEGSGSWRRVIHAVGSCSGSGDDEGDALSDQGLSVLSPGGRAGTANSYPRKDTAGTRFWMLADDCSDDSELGETALDYQGMHARFSKFLATKIRDGELVNRNSMSRMKGKKRIEF